MNFRLKAVLFFLVTSLCMQWMTAACDSSRSVPQWSGGMGTRTFPARQSKWQLIPPFLGAQKTASSPNEHLSEAPFQYCLQRIWCALRGQSPPSEIHMGQPMDADAARQQKRPDRCQPKPGKHILFFSSCVSCLGKLGSKPVCSS